MLNVLLTKHILVQVMLLILSASLLNGCGFTLRNKYNMPDSIQQLRLNAQELNSPLKRTLGKKLKPFRIKVLESSDGQKSEDDLSLYLMPDSLDRRLLSLFATGQVAEYELVYTVRYQLQFTGQEAETLEFAVTREYQDDPDAVLAKSRELDLVLGEMREQAAGRIIRQISTSYANMINQAILAN
ncbi:MAG: LPS-assembly lipoprotein [Paraglaciecola sp.]|jgi:LPS-assembly lipoprotein